MSIMVPGQFSALLKVFSAAHMSQFNEPALKILDF
jgi:hypothetical protein